MTMAFRWIINHLVGLFVLGAMIFVIVYRHEVGTRMAGVAEATGYGFVIAWLTSEPTPEPKKSPKQVPKAAPKKTPEPIAAPKPEPAPEPKIESKIEPEIEPKLEPETAAPAQAEPETPAPLAKAEPEPQATPEPAPKTATEAALKTAAQPATGPCLASGDKPDAAVIEAWAAARALYWRGDLTGAISAYEKLVQDHPDLADMPGELANIHIGQGRIDEAAGLYLETGLRLIKNSAPGCAARVAAILRSIDPEKADYLNKRIHANRRDQGAR